MYDFLLCSSLPIIMSSTGIQVGEIFHQHRHTDYANVSPVGSQTETVRYAVYEMAGAKQ